MIRTGKSDKKGKKATTRTRIFAWAMILTALLGFVRFAQPLEDIYRAARNELRQRPADKSIVVVAVDEKTVEMLGSTQFSRSYNADLLDRAFALGAKRVYFDQAFSRPFDEAGDDQFATALSRYAGRAYIAGYRYYDPSVGPTRDVLPIPKLRDFSHIRSVDGASTPFSLSAELTFAEEFQGQKVRALAADIAGVDGEAGKNYRPDWSIKAKSVPTISMADLLSGKVPAEAVRGRDLIVGMTTPEANDFVHVAIQGWFAGVYVHAVGAQTLKEGTPVDLGWLPMWLLAAAFSASFLWAKRNKNRQVVVLFATASALVIPFIADVNFITADFIPAYLLFGTVVYRGLTLRSLDQARLQNAETLLPNLSALREEALAGVRPIVAMRIKNYGAVSASFVDSIEDELITELARRLSLPGEATTFYQAEDVLYWLGPALSREELEAHLEGLTRLIESHFMIRERKLDIHVAFGVDNDQARSISSRIGRALLAADTAAAKHQLIAFSTIEDDDDRAWELSLMSELDAAIDSGDIWVAYQPQFDLKTNSIFGVEALVRWQHPARGAISPESFIGPAESHNRMMRLTLNILKQATAACRPLVDRNPGFRLSVNLSASLLEHSHLPERIGEILYLTAFPSRSLTLEVTESAPFAEHQIVSRNLAELASIGIELSIDDYGTGNATLEYLRTVPCQEIKIDRRFVSGLAGNLSDRLLVESTIELAHGLGRRVIAEGIEDKATLDQLREIGCDVAQGYFLAKPMRFEALSDMLEANAGKIRAA